MDIRTSSLGLLAALALAGIGCSSSGGEMSAQDKANFKGSGGGDAAAQSAGMARSMNEFKAKNPDGVVRAPGMPHDPK